MSRTQASIKEQINKAHTDIIVVTYNNYGLLRHCLYSLILYNGSPYDLHIVNNGTPHTLDNLVKASGNIHVYDTGSNLGWMGGINFVKDKVKGPFVLLLNDDTQFIHHDWGWLRRLLLPFFSYKNVGAVGPTSNNVGGIQGINVAEFMPRCHNTAWLSGFCLLTKKEYLDKVNWLDESLPGGDDIDLSIKLQDLGLALIVCRDVTVLHHYAATGYKVHGAYWDSIDHTEKINIALIQRHGLKRWLKIIRQEGEQVESEGTLQKDNEDKIIAKYLGKNGLAMGCGNRSFPNTLGIDLTPGGTIGSIGSQEGRVSKSSILGDVEALPELPSDTYDHIVAEDIIEHVINPIKALREWHRLLKVGGKVMVFTTDEDKTRGILLDPTHTHVFDEEFLEDLLLSTGFKIIEQGKIHPGTNLYAIAEKS